MTMFPSRSDYAMAVQDPTTIVADELKAVRFVTAPGLDIPFPSSGDAAVVFRASLADQDTAVRFFLRQGVGLGERYSALNEFFAAKGLTEHMASCHWVEEAITVNGRRWPAVRMEWVDGDTLDQHVGDLVTAGDLASVDRLATRWRELVATMQRSGFAHGDLQHGNVLVDRSGRFRLVDFDASWTAGLANLGRPQERGHRNYQRQEFEWDQWMDTFPALVIYLSLRVLAREPAVWERHGDADNLLFVDTDFADLDAPVWRAIDAMDDAEITRLALRLRECCAEGWTPFGGLESLLAARAWWAGRTSVQPTAQPTPLQPTSTQTRTRPEPTRPPEPVRPAPEPVAVPRRDPARTWWGDPLPQPTAPTPPVPQPVQPPAPSPRPSRTPAHAMALLVWAVAALAMIMSQGVDQLGDLVQHLTVALIPGLAVWFLVLFGMHVWRRGQR